MNFVDVYNSNLVLVTETWLCNKIPDEVIHLPDMTCLRKDRTSGICGGVVMYISIPLKERRDLIHSNFECLWATFRPIWLPRCISRLAAAVVYLPPSMSAIEMQ